MNPTFLDYLLGVSDMALYKALWAFALIGVALGWHLDVRKRDKDSDATPQTFSWFFFLSDNFRRIFASVILIFIFLRFPDYLLTVYVPVIGESVELRLLVAFFIGLLNDKLALWLKKINFLGMGKSPIREKIREINENVTPNKPDNGPGQL